MNHTRNPRKQELKHRKGVRFVKVNNIPATWIETSLDISDKEAIIIFKQHQAQSWETLKSPSKSYPVNFFG